MHKYEYECECECEYGRWNATFYYSATDNKQQRHNIVIVAIGTMYYTCTPHIRASCIWCVHICCYCLFYLPFHVKSLLFRILFGVFRVWCPDNGSRTLNLKRKYLWKYILLDIYLYSNINVCYTMYIVHCSLFKYIHIEQ